MTELSLTELVQRMGERGLENDKALLKLVEVMIERMSQLTKIVDTLQTQQVIMLDMIERSKSQVH